MCYTRAPYAFESLHPAPSTTIESLQETFSIQQATSTGKSSCRSTKSDYQIDIQVSFTQPWIEHEQQQDYLFNIACAIHKLQ
jgi:hypothetical protein